MKASQKQTEALPVTFRIPEITGSFLLGEAAKKLIIIRRQGKKNETHVECGSEIKDIELHGGSPDDRRPDDRRHFLLYRCGSRFV